MTPTTPSPISDQAAGELLPCPFCGEAVTFAPYKHDGLKIECKPCVISYAQRTMRFDLDWLAQKMAAHWNRRSTAPTTGSAPTKPTLKEIWEGAEYPEMKMHRWDKEGERCLDCGQSEYIGGECVTLSATRHAPKTCNCSGLGPCEKRTDGSCRVAPASPAASALSEDAILAIAIDHGLGTAVVESIAKALLAASMGGDRT